MVGVFFLVFLSIRPVAGHFAVPHRIQNIEFLTDGCLDRTWVLKVLQLQKEMELNAVDVQACRNALRRASQVIDADVERVYPSTLRVRIRERVPVFKVRLPDERRLYLLDADGHVFEQIGAPKDKLANVPYVLGLDIDRISVGDRIPLMKDLFIFWNHARRHAPELVRKWRMAVVDEAAYNLMGHLPFIEVRTDEVRSIIFKNESHSTQLEKLEYILNDARKRHQLPLQRIDLTVPDRAYVKPGPRFSENAREREVTP
ncbi:MAG: FtsQ-type POTRA domain-containing protein [Puniceicoccales bacterium]|jgi:cell division septal protein FtsQ|nr:FtsQ-type POTRA domain-containing protein [Puniceicoccales bacterium]